MSLCPDCVLAQQTTRPSYSPSLSVGTLLSRISDTQTARRCLEYAKQWLWGEGLRGLQDVYIVLRNLDCAGQSVLGTNRVELNPGEETTWVLGVCVHELTHHWLWNHGIEQSEGFCHLAMRQFFLHMDTSTSRRLAYDIQYNSPPKYRNGLARVLAASERAGGFRRYIDQVKSSQSLAA